MDTMHADVVVLWLLYSRHLGLWQAHVVARNPQHDALTLLDYKTDWPDGNVDLDNFAWGNRLSHTVGVKGAVGSAFGVIPAHPVRRSKYALGPNVLGHVDVRDLLDRHWHGVVKMLKKATP